MEKSEIKSVQAKMAKLKKGGFFVYYFDKKDKTSDSQGHNIVVSKKVSEAMVAFKANKKTDSKISRGTFFFDPAQAKFMFEVAAGDTGRLEKGLRKLASKGAPILKQVLFPTADEIKAAKAAIEAGGDESSSSTSESTATAPAPISAEDAALLQKFQNGEDLTDEEAIRVLGLDIEQEIMEDFDQSMLDAFLSPDMSAEADLDNQAAFSKFKADFLGAKSAYNAAVRSIHGDIKAQVQANGDPEAVALAKKNRDKIKGAVIGATKTLEGALDTAGAPDAAAARTTVTAELTKLITFISTDPIVGLLRRYPHVSISGDIRSCRTALEKMQVQVDVIARSAAPSPSSAPSSATAPTT